MNRKDLGLLVLIIVVGVRVLPRLLGYVAGLRDHELFTLAAVAIALGIAYVSFAVFGVSLDELKARRLAAIDAEAEAIRQSVITAGAGQAMVYDGKRAKRSSWWGAKTWRIAWLIGAFCVVVVALELAYASNRLLLVRTRTASMLRPCCWCRETQFVSPANKLGAISHWLTNMSKGLWRPIL